MIPVLALLVGGLAGCEESLPTAASEELLPFAPRTVEIRLPWEAFATDLDVYGGFSSPFLVGGGLLAHEYRGTLEARTLARVVRLNRVVTVVDSTGATVTDSLGSIKGGRLVAHFDSLSPSVPAAMTVSAHRVLTSWDPSSATWTHAVDTLGETLAWPEAGGGPAQRIGLGEWAAGQGDSLVVPVDSATLAAWADSLEVGRGVRIDMETPDVRLELNDVFLRFEMVPSVNRDTVLTLTADTDTATFIYTPLPDPPASGIRVGGAPAWRTAITTDIPRELTGPPELCALVGCPFRLTPENLSHASLVLETREVMPAAFQPSDSARIDARPVLSPERLPRAPLGSSLITLFGNLQGGLPVAGAAFGADNPTRVSLPITEFVRALLDEPPEEGPAPSGTLALLAAFEPFSVTFAEFAGPGGPGAPFLRLLVTVADSVRLP